MTITQMFDDNDNPITTAKGSSYKVKIPIEKTVSNDAFIARNLKNKIIVKTKFHDATQHIATKNSSNIDKPIRQPAW